MLSSKCLLLYKSILSSCDKGRNQFGQTIDHFAWAFLIIQEHRWDLEVWWVLVSYMWGTFWQRLSMSQSCTCLTKIKLVILRIADWQFCQDTLVKFFRIIWQSWGIRVWISHSCLEQNRVILLTSAIRIFCVWKPSRRF